MLIVTDKAAEFMRQALGRKGEGAPASLRIVYAEDGYQLTLDDPKEGDQVFEQGGDSYLLVDPSVGDALSDATIDLQESVQGTNLTLTATRTPEAEAEASAKTEGHEPEGKL